jgi:hypothetical protein
MRLIEFTTQLRESTVEINHDLYDETERLNNRLMRSTWKKVVANAITEIFNSAYPDVKLRIKNSSDGISISTGTGEYQNNPNNEFIANIFGPGAWIGNNDIIYVGLNFYDIDSGKYKGVVLKFLSVVVPKLAAIVNGYPSIMIFEADESGEAWGQIANKLGWPYIDETDAQ